MSDNSLEIRALKAIAEALDAPRNRFGKLQPSSYQYAVLRDLLCELGPRFPEIIPNGGRDIVDQAVMACRAVVASAEHDQETAA